MSEQNKRPYRYRCSNCGHGTTLMLHNETPTVETWCTCCSKNMEDNKTLVRFKEVG
jgi:predicted nucleic acid-binding Zn ribbon protein